MFFKSLETIRAQNLSTTKVGHTDLFLPFRLRMNIAFPFFGTPFLTDRPENSMMKIKLNRGAGYSRLRENE